MRAAPGQFLFINSEILAQHCVGKDTAFATMGYLLAHFSLVLVQPIVEPIITSFRVTNSGHGSYTACALASVGTHNIVLRLLVP